MYNPCPLIMARTWYIFCTEIMPLQKPKSKIITYPEAQLFKYDDTLSRIRILYPN